MADGQREDVASVRGPRRRGNRNVVIRSRAAGDVLMLPRCHRFANFRAILERWVALRRPFSGVRVGRVEARELPRLQNYRANVVSPPRRVVRAILNHLRHAALAQNSFAARFAPHAQLHQIERAELAICCSLHYETGPSILGVPLVCAAADSGSPAAGVPEEVFGLLTPGIVTLALPRGICSRCSLLSFPVSVAINAPENPENVEITTMLTFPVSP